MRLGVLSVTDTFAHILLGLTPLFAFHAAVLALGPLLAAGLFAAFTLYFREVTQKQGSAYDNDFRRGWLPWKWSLSKNIETWVPVGVVLAVAAAIEFGVQ